MNTILVFPSSLDSAVRFAAHSRELGSRVVGASSLAVDPSAERYNEWVHLPFISDPMFFTALRSTVERLGITMFYTSHAPTFLFLTEQLASHLPEIKLLGESPYERQMRWVGDSYAAAQDQAHRVDGFAGRQGTIDPRWLSALLTQAGTIYGECSAEKILALCGIFASVPRGDVVEIGSFFGKSAYVLNRLAYRFGIGSTLAIDPWDMENSIQHGSPETIQKLSRVWDWDRVFDGFLLTMQACSAPPFNYIRATSEQAYASYQTGSPVRSLQFGEMLLAGTVAVLHIDGNHDAAAVAHDLSMWGAQLVRGGWIVVDDYEWSLGDGPRRAADNAIAAYGGRVRRRLVAGGALFINVE
jgi:hypothetical protein